MTQNHVQAYEAPLCKSGEITDMTVLCTSFGGSTSEDYDVEDFEW